MESFIDGWNIKGTISMLSELIQQFETASATYAADNGLERDDDWFVLKLQEEMGELAQLNDFAIMEHVSKRVESIVEDKRTAEALKPWYNRLCKRPCFHDDYLPTFNRPNVELVDTNGQGVDAITENGLVVAGKEYKVDCIVYATGFDVTPYAGFSMPIYGRNGLSLSEKWKDGATTLHGIHVNQFPNMFIISTTQSAWGSNFPHMMDEQAHHISYIIQEARSRGVEVVEVAPEAESAWVALHEQLAGFLTRVWADCTPSYFNNEGQVSPAIKRNGGFGGGVERLIDILKQWRGSGEMAGLKLD